METLIYRGKIIKRRRIAIISGLAVNIVLGFIAYKLKIPMYLDTAGTIFVAAVAGAVPGMLTGVMTNAICGMFNDSAFYYTFVSVLIAISTSCFASGGKFKRKKYIVILIPILAVICGIFGTICQWVVMGGPQFKDVADIARLLGGGEAGFFFGSMLVNTGINIIDKTVTVSIAAISMYLISDNVKLDIANSFWKQKPLDSEEISRITDKKNIRSLMNRVTLILLVASVTLALAMTWISMEIYYTNTRKEYTTNAKNAAKLASYVINPAMVDEYLKKGEMALGYEDTREKLYQIRDNSVGIKYLYVVDVRKDGCHYIFDLESEDMEAYRAGYVAEIEAAFKPYMPKLLEGEEIEPIESSDVSGWVITAYCPVKNDEGETVCYVGTDVSMNYLSDYVLNYLAKNTIVFSGFFVLILAFGIWVSKFYLVYPISSMTGITKEFAANSDDQVIIDNNVKRLRDIEIRTNDEVGDLYHAVCKMAVDMADNMRSIRHYAEATAKMQNGLIITMADMVENRDQETGDHVRKTAAYVRIILEALKTKGYYQEKLTLNYMNDVEMSAPLHDVGKINIPDAVLNKPGRLTDEEYEIMKTHTTAGKKIIENAIDSVEGENYLKEARNMAAYHHERWDGKGYPEKLYGEVIPLSARVMAVADVFDALTSPRVYKPSFPLEKALAIIEEGSGTQFDPKVVEAFMDSLDEVKKVLKKYNPDVF